VSKPITFVGLDVHKQSIAVAVAEANGEPWSWGRIRNEPGAIVRLVEELGATETTYAYEAGPTGYALCRQLRELGARCVVAAPSKIAATPGDRVKTDRRDALKLARLLRRGDLTAVWVPDPAQEAFRDLTRARQTAKGEQQRVRNRLTKLLLRLAIREPTGVARWSNPYRRWLENLGLAQPAQQVVLDELRRELQEAEARLERLGAQLKAACATHPQSRLITAFQTLRGVGLLTAATIVAELGDPARFASARQLMGYVGYGLTESSSGERVHRGGITRAGNAHFRHVVGEGSWQYPRPVRVGKVLTGQRRGQPAAVVAIAERADQRLHGRYWRLVNRGKLPQTAIVAVARELVGFIWAIARVVSDLPIRERQALTKAA
jgi:transposase